MFKGLFNPVPEAAGKGPRPGAVGAARVVGSRARGRLQRRWLDVTSPNLARLLALSEGASLSPQRQQIGLYNETRRVLNLGLGGTFLEIGVNLGGGSVMLTEATAVGGRDLHLFDRWGDQPEPSAEDGARIVEFAQALIEPRKDWLREEDLVQAVRDLLVTRVGMPEERVFFHQGWVQDTLPQYDGGPVAFCHLDLDFYEGTRYTLAWLDEHLAERAIVVFNDWRHFEGVRRAYWEFALATDRRVALHERDGHGVVDVGAI